MGKGDKKTAKGKIVRGSYGKTRPRKLSKRVVVPEKVEKIKAEPKPKATKAKVEKPEKEESPKPKRTKKTEE